MAGNDLLDLASVSMAPEMCLAVLETLGTVLQTQDSVVLRNFCSVLEDHPVARASRERSMGQKVSPSLLEYMNGI